MAWGFVSCGPNQVMVVSGCCHSRPLLVPGGRVFVWPMINKIQYLSLNIMPINLESNQVISHDSIRVTIKSTAQVKIINKKTDLRNACGVFLGMKIEAMTDFLRNTIEGHQRSVIGKFTLEEIYFKRDSFAQQVTNCAFNDLSEMGITLLSLSVNEVIEDEGIIASLLEKKSAENQANLRISQAEAKLECISEKVFAEEEASLKKASLASNALSMMADLQLAKLNNDIEISKALASASFASNLTAIKNSQVMREHELQLKELEANVALLNAETDVKLVQLDVLKTIMDSSANLQAVETTAKANNFHDVTKAFADAQVIRLKGSSDADSLVLDERKVLAQELQSNCRKLSQALAAFTPSPSASSYFVDGETHSIQKQGNNLDNSTTNSTTDSSATVTDEPGQPEPPSISSRSSFTSSILFTLDKLASSFLRTSAADDISTGGLTPRYPSTPNSPYSLREASISEEAIALKSTVDPQFSELTHLQESNLLANKEITNEWTGEKGNDFSFANETTVINDETVAKNICVTDSSQRKNDDLESEKRIEASARTSGDFDESKLPLLNEPVAAETEKISSGDNDDDEMDEFTSSLSQTIGEDGDDDDSTLVSLSESTETEPVILKVSHVIGINLTNAILSTVFQEVLELLK